MTAFEKIIEAIQPFGYPYTAGVYEGKEKRWFTFNYSDDYGDAYADDTPQSVIVEVQIHFFTFPEIHILEDENPDIRHLVFECEIEEREGE